MCVRFVPGGGEMRVRFVLGGEATCAAVLAAPTQSSAAQTMSSSPGVVGAVTYVC